MVSKKWHVNLNIFCINAITEFHEYGHYTLRVFSVVTSIEAVISFYLISVMEIASSQAPRNDDINSARLNNGIERATCKTSLLM